MKHNNHGNAYKRTGHALARQKRIAKAISETGQAATFTFEPQRGPFTHPAKRVDACTRALIDQAMAARR